MTRPSTEALRTYVAHCPSCGKELISFTEPYQERYMEMFISECSCGKRWSYIFDLDESGTFGVMSFQCENGDRV